MPGASENREKDGPLNLAARLGLYAMLAGLVVASFTVTPAQRAQPMAAPATVDEPAEPAGARIAPMSRGLARAPRDVDDLEIVESPISTTESPTAPATDAMPEALAAVPVEPEPEATAIEPAPAATPVPTPTPTPRPTVRPASPPTNSSALGAEVRMLELINASRARGGLLPLVMDAGVASTARAHSGAEAQVGYVYHDGADGTAKSRDVPACGSGWYGENTGKIWNGSVDALHNEFMNEPWIPINHRTNIMDPAFRRIGVGAVNGPDAMYITMVFCR